MPPEFEWSWLEFCGSDSFQIWTSNHQDLSSCFQLLCLQIPLLSIIAIVSAYYAGMHTALLSRTSREKRILKFRMCLVLLLACRPIVETIVFLCYTSKSLHVIDYGFVALASITWFVHCSFVSTMHSGMTMSLRGPVKLVSLWMMLFVACIIHTRSIFLKFQDDRSLEASISLTSAFITIVFQILYGFSLFFGDDSDSRRSTIGPLDQEDVMRFDGYVRFREDFDERHLGTAMMNNGFLSKLFFTWVNPLIEKGTKSQIHVSEDVYDLPEELSSPIHVNTSEMTLFSMLHREIAVEFYSSGLLKLISTFAALATPLLLNELLKCLGDEKIPIFQGYLYAGGIVLASIIGSFCAVHFNFYAGKMSIKSEAFLMMITDKRMLNLDLRDAMKLNLNLYGSLMMRNDMERIANLWSSIHNLWSSSLQVVVTLYLLYGQVGVASFCCVLCPILLSPVNKIVEKKIRYFHTRMMWGRDKRIALTSEFMRGIREIRLYMWENYFVSRILGFRAGEVKYLKYEKYLHTLFGYFFITSPVMTSTLTFTVLIYLGGTLDAPVVFTSLLLLNLVQKSLKEFPGFDHFGYASTSMRRAERFLRILGKRAQECTEETETQNWCGMELSVTDTPETFFSSHKKRTFSDSESSSSSDSESESTSSANYKAKVPLQKGQLMGVYGPARSGKSFFLNTVLGLLRTSWRSVGYVPQTPWIQKGSIRDNIIFGLPYDEDRYRSVIAACALAEDIRSWPKGDDEIVGESTCILSDSQKVRIGLARAAYADVQFYFIDDILSSVDQEVAVHVFDECVVKLLAGKTRIMVLGSLPNEQIASVTWFVGKKDGKIIHQNDLVLVREKLNEMNAKHTPIKVFRVRNERNLEEERKSGSEDDMYQKMTKEMRDSSSGQVNRSPCNSDSANEKSEVSPTMDGVKRSTYHKYLKSFGCGFVVLYLLSAMGLQVSRVAVDWWLSVCVSVKTDHETNRTSLYYLAWFERAVLGNDPLSGSFRQHFLTVLMTIGTINAVMAIALLLMVAFGGIHAAVKTHAELLRRLSEVTLQFFYSSSSGEILERFSTDLNTVDYELPYHFHRFALVCTRLVGIMVIMLYGIPWLCLCVIPLAPVYLWLHNQYRITSRQLERIISSARSDVYSHMRETLSGLFTIVAFNESFHRHFALSMKVDSLHECQLAMVATQAWLNLRLKLIGICVIGVVCAISVLQSNFDVVHVGCIGLTIVYALTLLHTLEDDLFGEMEDKAAAFERIDELIQSMKPESHDTESNVVPTNSRLNEGTISFRKVSLLHRLDSTRHSLKNVTFQILSSERIGIVGRSGAGKSALFSSLFRLEELCDGQICVGKEDIRNIPLKRLRSTMTLIPKEPTIFTGTVHNNLDPLNLWNEHRIPYLLNQFKLESYIELLGGMHGHMSNAAADLPVTEKQLIGLLRAILKQSWENSEIVCIDEVATNDDPRVDGLLRSIIKNAFRGKTVLIATRHAETVLDCDRVLVMDGGEVKEFDSPQSLLENKDSHFYKLVNHEL